MTFDKWFNGPEGFGFRSECITEELDVHDTAKLMTLIKWLEAAYEEGRMNERYVSFLYQKCQENLVSLTGNKKAADDWWNTKNKAMKGATPLSVFTKDPNVVYSYLIRCGDGEW